MDPVLAAFLRTWAGATEPAFKDKCFQDILSYIRANPQVARQLTGTALAAYEAYMMRTMGIRVAAGVGIRHFVPRLLANFGTAPKVPHPVVLGLVFIGSVALAGCSAHAEVAEQQAAMPSYQRYVEQYLRRCFMVLQHNPKAQLSSPQDFQVWYSENRT